ncbi:Golgi-associated RAB2B interactor protein 3-like [Macrobrachium nipponense]|uniref:Golgi-associated RAB2B interactor protein 3-like n=1 Tax=Macrobrachium nipponense TaxID=159736 RepID=UPI0030C8AA28
MTSAGTGTAGTSGTASTASEAGTAGMAGSRGSPGDGAAASDILGAGGRSRGELFGQRKSKRGSTVNPGSGGTPLLVTVAICPCTAAEGVTDTMCGENTR